MSELLIHQAAPRMLIQDLGRTGHGHHAISQGGPLDLHAHCWANKLLENSPDCATLEISLGNAEFEAKSDTVIALAGADMQARIDGSPVANWSSHVLRAGQVLKFNYASCGNHAYLAIAGGFQTEPTLGSRAMVLRNGIGTALRSGDALPYRAEKMGAHFKSISTPFRFRPDYLGTRDIRLILPAEQERSLSSAMLNTDFTISPKSDRMGMHLDASTPLPSQAGILSEAIALGTIQLPPNGHPIVLLNDRQTQGGYAKVGTVARLDLPLLTQARAGSSIRFRPESVDSAQHSWLEFARFFLSKR